MSKKKDVTYRRIGLMIGSPGDATDERQAITDTVIRWNAANKDQGYWIEPVKWETHATPGLDGRPQGMINEELIPQSDCLLAVFRARAGSPTGEEISGTIEEIRQFMKLGKLTVVYFYEGQVSLKTIDADQLNRVSEFKQEIQKHGITETYISVDDLRAKLASQLSVFVKRLASTSAQPKRSRSSKVSNSPMSPAVTPSRMRSKAELVSGQRRSPEERAVVNDSDQWTLIGDAYLEAQTVRHNRDGTITAEIPSNSAKVDASIAALQPYHYGRAKPIPFAHGNDARIVNVREIESVSEANGRLWTIVLVPEAVEYGGSQTEITLNTGKKRYSPDEIATLRARRILLNYPPPVDDSQRTSTDQKLMDQAMLEAQIRGVNTLVTVSDCIIRVVYAERRQADTDFLKLARLASIFMLRVGGVVEHVHKLTLGPIHNGLVHVDFVGVRRKQYANREATVIRMKGDCPLA